jgi:DNA adenine methylase
MKSTTEPVRYVDGVVPFLKWAGGKRQLLDQYTPFFPDRALVNHYFEPFIGSAAVFFHLQYPQATLSDQNCKLIELYQMVQQDVESVIQALRPHRNQADYYYDIRAQDPQTLSPVERAARLIYLNKTCYNGLYRENRQGVFNVPFGRYKNPTICDEKKLRKAAQALEGVNLTTADFAHVVENAELGDFVYFDPPYVPLNATSSFTSYHRAGFSQSDHQRLAQTIHKLTARGCLVMLSNSSAPYVYELYQDRGYHLIRTTARRSINSQASKRGPVTELLILNYEPRQ